jgi:hypothetical protein
MTRWKAILASVAAATVLAALRLGAAGGVAPGAFASRGYPVKVYFSRHPISEDQVGAVYAARRVAPTLGVATFAIGQLLTGPTAAEAAAGYYTELTLNYHGRSTCGPAGFTIRLNRRGSASEPGTATLRFCRSFTLPGLGAGARITAEVCATLLQFASIRRVVILTRDGSCFEDLSGRSLCLRAAP